MERSSLILNAKDIDSKQGIVSFYFADFNSIDAHGRRMNRTAFNRTFNNNFKRFKHLLNHYNVIGKPLEVGTDSKGAFMVSQLSKSTDGKDALIKYEEGIITEHSFGFNILNSETDGDVEVVNELQMMEASSLDTWGANPNTPTISLNSNTEMLKDIKTMTEVHTQLLAMLKNQDKGEIIEVINQNNDKLLKDMEVMNVVNTELITLLKNEDNKNIMSILNDISARLPDPKGHQTSQKSQIDEVIEIINKKY